MTSRVPPGPALLAGRVLAVVRGSEGRHTAAVLDTLAADCAGAEPTKGR